MMCFCIGTNRTIGTNGHPSYHLAKVTWYRLSCTILVSSAPNSKYSFFHILALSLSDTLEFIGGLGDENN